MFTAYMTFPDWIKPEIIPGFPLGSWYGLMYIFAFATAWFVFRIQIKQRRTEQKTLKAQSDKPLRLPDFSDETVGNFFTAAIVGLLLGARLFSVLIYADNRVEFWTQPWLIFWPFENGQFVGLRGMSYHGGVVGTVVATVAYCRYKGQNFWDWADMLATAIPLGYTFGRLGNFINQELYGRVTSSPIGMIFNGPGMEKFSAARDPWAVELATELGISPYRMINLPRHPSQLYEMVFEGVVLWAVLWFIVRRFKKHNGQMLGSYLLGYGLVRFIIEYYRQPDSHLGYIINLTGKRLNPALEHPLGAISLGQLFCLMMVAAGALLIFLAPKLNRRAEKQCDARLDKLALKAGQKSDLPKKKTKKEKK